MIYIYKYHSIEIFFRCIFSSSALSVKRRKSKIAISQKNFKSIPIQGTFEYKLRQMKDPYVKKCREEGYRYEPHYSYLFYVEVFFFFLFVYNFFEQAYSKVLK